MSTPRAVAKAIESGKRTVTSLTDTELMAHLVHIGVALPRVLQKKLLGSYTPDGRAHAPRTCNTGARPAANMRVCSSEFGRAIKYTGNVVAPHDAFLLRFCGFLLYEHAYYHALPPELSWYAQYGVEVKVGGATYIHVPHGTTPAGVCHSAFLCNHTSMRSATARYVYTRGKGVVLRSVKKKKSTGLFEGKRLRPNCHVELYCGKQARPKDHTAGTVDVRPQSVIRAMAASTATCSVCKQPVNTRKRALLKHRMQCYANPNLSVHRRDSAFRARHARAQQCQKEGVGLL